MNYILKRAIITIICLTGLLILGIKLSSCNADSQSSNNKSMTITDTEIIAFQKAYGISFNAISRTVNDNGYYESAARNHLDDNYNFEEEVIFKFGNEDKQNYRSTYEGLLSYLIGKNNKYPKDKGVAKKNYRKIDWSNEGIVKNGDMAIVMGNSTLTDENENSFQRSFTMCLKKDKSGQLKLVAHKIVEPCDK